MAAVFQSHRKVHPLPILGIALAAGGGILLAISNTHALFLYETLIACPGHSHCPMFTYNPLLDGYGIAGMSALAIGAALILAYFIKAVSAVGEMWPL